MQVLKDEIKNTIEECALKEFYQKGYKGASMRVIAAQAGISPGNLYHYFTSKEELFKAIMAPAYHKAQDLIRLSDGSGETLAVMQGIAKETLPELIANQKALVVLMEKSQGTEYANTKQAFIQVTGERLIKEMGTDEAFGRVLAASLVEGILLILQGMEKEKEAREALMALLHFYFYNWKERI